MIKGMRPRVIALVGAFLVAGTGSAVALTLGDDGHPSSAPSLSATSTPTEPTATTTTPAATSSTRSASSATTPVRTTSSASRTSSTGGSAGGSGGGSTEGQVDGHVGGRTLELTDDHYGTLRIGMSVKDVLRSGWVRREPRLEADLAEARTASLEGVQHCPGAFEDKYRNGYIWVSDDRGVESMMFTRGVRTEAGVAIGTPWEEMLRRYHHPKVEDLHGRAVVPLGSGVILWFEGKNGSHGREVGMITIARVDQRCYE